MEFVVPDLADGHGAGVAHRRRTMVWMTKPIGLANDKLAEAVVATCAVLSTHRSKPKLARKDLRLLRRSLSASHGAVADFIVSMVLPPEEAEDLGVGRGRQRSVQQRFHAMLHRAREIESTQAVSPTPMSPTCRPHSSPWVAS